MTDQMGGELVTSLLVVLAAGLVAGVVCRRFGVSLLVGYLVVGALLGDGGLRLVSQEHGELEYLARGGVLFLLFSVGIEFSLEELRRLGRSFVVGGAAQMLLVALPVAAGCLVLGATWGAALLVGFAVALSSTVLVFKALAESGESASPHGRRGIGILVFQDIALVPLMLLVPLLTQSGEPPTAASYVTLAARSAIFVSGVFVLRRLIARIMVPMLAALRSIELLVLFTLGVLGGACYTAYLLGLPPSIGALAAGLMLAGHRLSGQIDTIVLPYRESFAALFFVTLGTLLEPRALLEEPVLLVSGLAGVVVLKSLAAAAALRLAGLGWQAAFGMGLGLAQMGEFSFLLLAEGLGEGVIGHEAYARVLFVALGSMVLTPQLLRVGLSRVRRAGHAETTAPWEIDPSEPIRHAIVVGGGPIGRRVAARLETIGVDVCMVDLSPINLHPFAQLGFRTVAGDGGDPDVLGRAGLSTSDLVVLSVPDDTVCIAVARLVRQLAPGVRILARCHYQGSVETAAKAGADVVVCEEAELSSALLRVCDSLFQDR